jgi:protein ImuB
MALDELLPRLCALLAGAGQGARCFHLTGYRADGGMGTVGVALSQPVNSPAIIKRLFRDRLERIDCGFGIDLFTLEGIDPERVTPGQHDMVDPHNSALTSASLTTFADTLNNRSESRAVSRFAPCASHVPERAQRFAPIATQVDWQRWKALQPVWAPRPLRLFVRPEPAEVTAELPDSPPAQFIWRRVLRRVVRSRGPERILPEWWHDSLKSSRSALFRDYYDVEDTEGRRYWIFRSTRSDPVEQDPMPIEEVTTIRWFVHGLF